MMSFRFISVPTHSLLESILFFSFYQIAYQKCPASRTFINFELIANVEMSLVKIMKHKHLECINTGAQFVFFFSPNESSVEHMRFIL